MNDPLDHPGRAIFPEMPRDRVFINAAYMSPEPRAAIDAIHRVADRMACPSFGTDEFFEPPDRIRERLARLVGGSPQRYSMTGSASFGTATLAWNLRVQADALVGARRRILGVDGQFPSNVQTWQRLEPFGFRLTLVEAGEGATQRLLASLDDDVALVAIEPLSWTDGRRLDFDTLLRRVHDAGALTLLDVTQSAAVDPPLADDLPCDVIVSGGYKWLLGPYGTGFLRLTEDLQERLEPLEWNWKNFEGSHDFNRLTEYRQAFAGPAAKFDHGESSAFLRLAAWEAGLEAIDELGAGAVAEHGRRFATGLRESLDLDRFEMSDVDDASQAAHLFRVAPRRPEDFDPLSQSLAAASIEVSRRAGGWRVSPHVYNDRDHLDRFSAALR